MKKVIAFAVCAITAVSMTVSSFGMDILKNGARGDEVTEVQEMLIAQGYLKEKADGFYGANTEKAVKAFQEENGLDATGLVGEGTYNALKNGTSVQKDDVQKDDVQKDDVQNDDVQKDDGATDPAEAFPSWNKDSESLSELVAFVTDAVDESSPNYIVPEDRIATFDMDGTILCEKAPIYIDWCMTMYRVLDDPDFNANSEELSAMQEIREHAYTDGETYHPEEGLNKDILVATAFAGMTPEEFHSYVVNFADTVDTVGFEGMKYGESFYLPMIEVINYLKANDFDVWMVSACEREVVRALVERFDIPFDHVIATDVPYITSGNTEGELADEYNMGKDEEILLSAPLDEVECGKSGKSIAIAREIGKRPVLAFGNSSGDFSMLNYAEGNTKYNGMGFLVVCDDTEREYGNEDKANEYYDEIEKEGWTAISMANDWATIYGAGVKKTELPGVEETLVEEEVQPEEEGTLVEVDEILDDVDEFLDEANEALDEIDKEVSEDEGALEKAEEAAEEAVEEALDGTEESLPDTEKEEALPDAA